MRVVVGSLAALVVAAAIGIGILVATLRIGNVELDWPMVSGVLYRPVGMVVPVGASNTVPVIGDVVLTNRSSRDEFRATTDTTGRFSVLVPPGKYLVTGRSDGSNSCVNPTVRVAARSIVHVAVGFFCNVQ